MNINKDINDIASNNSESRYDEVKNIVNTHYTGINSKNNIFLNTEGTVPFIQSEGMKNLRAITHGFTTRLGGVSTGIYESLNMGLHLEDDREKVLENYRRLGVSMGFDHTRISAPNQVHKSNILLVTEEDAGDGISRDLTHFEIDAQITNVPGIPLIVYTADCVPILLADPISRVVASVHAGWRGTVQGIAAKTIEKMISEYGCLPENIRAFIGPSIGPENYEVDQTVIDEIIKCHYIDMSPENVSYLDINTNKADDWQVKLEAGSDLENDDILNKDIYVVCHAGSYLRDNMPKDYIGLTQPNKGAGYKIYRTVRFRKRYMLNLWNLNELIMINAGLRVGNIYNSRLCTMKYHDIFFSHRYTKGRRGLNAGIIMLDKI